MVILTARGDIIYAQIGIRLTGFPCNFSLSRVCISENSVLPVRNRTEFRSGSDFRRSDLRLFANKKKITIKNIVLKTVAAGAQTKRDGLTALSIF